MREILRFLFTGGSPERQAKGHRRERPYQDVHHIEGVAKGHRAQAQDSANDPAIQARGFVPTLADRGKGAAGHVGASQAEQPQHDQGKGDVVDAEFEVVDEDKKK